ncbi:extracellular solute-binding protein [Mollicutes bacterium LVI A0039]|nr:extracellular solute-binding protein [Mollicutes bacterium LVI A0039]
MKKILTLLTVFVIALAGCSGDSSETIENTSDEVLTIWGFYEGAPKAALDYYAEQTGKEVEYQAIGWGDFQTKINTVIGTSDAPDILLLERSFMGTYVPSENIISLDALMAGEESFEAYKTNTALATKGPGIVGDEVKALGWENTASAFFYRSDLASKCLGINSVEEMEKATATIGDYTKLYEQLQASDDATCSSMALISKPAFATGYLQSLGAYTFNEDGSYTIPKDFDKGLENLKTFMDSKAVYSPTSDETQVTAGTQKDAFLGNIIAAWATQDTILYDQPGQWAIADTPLDFTAGGSYIAVTTNADTEMVKEFLNMTFLNETWLVDNMEMFGMVGNEVVMNKYLETADGTNDYFGGQNTVEKFAQINADIDYYVPVTQYDSGLGGAIDEAWTGYAIDKTYATPEEARNALIAELQSLYPGLEVNVA